MKAIKSKADRSLGPEVKLDRIRALEKRLNVLEAHTNQLTVLLETLLRERAGRYIEAQTDTLLEAHTGRLLEAQTDTLVALEEQRKGQKTIESPAPSGN